MLQVQQHRKLPYVSAGGKKQRNIRVKADHVTDCVFLPAHTTSNERDTHSFCVVWFGVKHAESAIPPRPVWKGIYADDTPIYMSSWPGETYQIEKLMECIVDI